MRQELTIWTKLGARFYDDGDEHVPALGKALLSLTSITRLDLDVSLLPPINLSASYPLNGIDSVVNSIVQMTTLR